MQTLSSLQLVTVLFILSMDNADYIMIGVFHSHTCWGSKIGVEPTQNDVEIPTKVKLGASYKSFPEKLESTEYKFNFLVFFGIYSSAKHVDSCLNSSPCPDFHEPKPIIISQIVLILGSMFIVGFLFQTIFSLDWDTFFNVTGD